MLPSSHTALSLEERKKALIRISQFMIRDELKEVREEVEESIVEMALYYGTSEKQGVAENQIGELVEKEIYFIRFPDYTLKGIINRLTEKGVIGKRAPERSIQRLIDNLVKRKIIDKPEPKERYYLTSTRRSELHRIVKANWSVVESVNQEVIIRTEQKYGAEVSPEQQSQILLSFYSFLAYLFIEKSNVVARILTNKKVEIVGLALPTKAVDNIAVETIDDDELARAQAEATKQIFEECTDTFADFLFLIMQNLICVQILNLDPECRSLERQDFSQKSLFLDTNVLLALLCPSDPRHMIAREFVKLSQSIGAKTVVSRRTCEEYLGLLEDANRAYQRFENERTLEKVGEHLDNVFLSSFCLEKKTTPSQTWEGYYIRMDGIKSILKRFNITYYSKEREDILRHPRLMRAAMWVNHCYLTMRGIAKNPRVREHDAFHMLLIKELRKAKASSSFLGPDYWFTTFDMTLSCADDAISSTLTYEDKTPSTMICSIWLDMISPFLTYSMRSEKGSKAFAEALRQQFAAIPFQVGTEDLIEIQGDWILYDWLTIENIVGILNEKWVKTYIEKAKKARSEWAEAHGTKVESVAGKLEPSSEIDKMTSEFAQRLDEKLSFLKTERLKLLQANIAQMSKEIEFLEAKQLSLRTEIKDDQKRIEEHKETIQAQEEILQSERTFKRKWRTVAGLAGLALIFFNLLFLASGMFPRDVVTISCFTACIVVGAILLYFSIAYEKAKIELTARYP